MTTPIPHIDDGYIHLNTLTDDKKELVCGHCGGKVVIKLPMALPAFSATLQRFVKKHKNCQPPAPTPAMLPLGDALSADYPERLRVMHAMYGADPLGRRCGLCRHLINRHYSRNYYKCSLTTQTNGASTDWRTRWPACGKFEDDQP